MSMTKKDRERVLVHRKQNVVCDQCGQEIYRPYPFGSLLMCHACHSKAKAASRVHPDQLPLFHL